MHYSIFEAIPEPSQGKIAGDYYKSLVPTVRGISGFVKDTFFGSPHVTGKAVNIAEWKDSDAINRWRNEGSHSQAQDKAKNISELSSSVGTSCCE